jgi:hypothetical protein
VVVDLEKEKELKVHDRTLIVGWPDSPRVRPVILARATKLAAGAKLRPDTGLDSSAASGHRAQRSQATSRSDARESHTTWRCLNTVHTSAQWLRRARGKEIRSYLTGCVWSLKTRSGSLLELSRLGVTWRQVGSFGASGHDLTLEHLLSWPLEIDAWDLNEGRVAAIRRSDSGDLTRSSVRSARGWPMTLFV